MPGEDLPAAEAIATPPLGESSSAPVPPSAAGKPESDASGKMAPAGDGRRLEGAGGSGAENADPRARETTAPEVRSARPQARKEAAVPLALKDDATREDKDDQKTRLTRAPSSDVSAPARPPAPAAAAPPAEAQADALSETKKATAPRTSRTAQPQSGPAAQTQYKAEMAIVPFEVRASAQRRYRGIGGVLQQSDDAGVTWRDVLSNTGVTFTSGACASPDACWFGATGGVVLFRSSTGTRRFVLPVTSDVARVTATSADAAEVTLATGERFRTVDGGREWTRVP